MSISSLIGGGDTGAHTQTSQSQSQSSPPTNAPPSSNQSMQPPSPRRHLSSAARSDLQPYQRQPSPDRHMYGNSAVRASEGHNYGTASPARAYSHQDSPDQSRPSLSQTPQPYKPMVFQNQRSYAPSTHDAHARDPRLSTSGIPPRPNSQPNGFDQPPPESRSMQDRPGQGRAQHGPSEERRRTLGESHHTRPNVVELLGGLPESSNRDRPSTVQPVSHSPFSPPRDQRSVMAPNPASRTPWRQPISEDAPRESTENRRDEPSAPYRSYGGYSAPPQGPSPYGGPGPGPEDMVRGRSLDHLNQRVAGQYHVAPTSDPHSADRQRSEQLSRSLSSGGNAYLGRSIYDQPRRPEDMHHAKSLLSFGPDVNRRTGRASPLPQAVQGAQAQPLSIGKDPHVKSEFGRMFSGLGGLGSSTPSRGSPMPQGAQESFPAGTDLNDHLRLQRVSSQNGRKPKRVKDEDGMYDNDTIDGRGTPIGGRGAKRSKPNHHHHHHAHTHQ
jgi:hypothetical protein